MTFAKGHALAIGVGLYGNNPRANVPIAATDAQAVAEVLKDPKTCGYPDAQVKLVVNDGATKVGTLAALDELSASTGEGDTVFLFYCGHGAFGEDGNFSFVSSDARMQSGKVVAGTGVSEAEFIEKLRAIKAQRILVALNTCYSGSVSPSLNLDDQTLEISMPPSNITSAILGTGKGRIIITAAGEDQRSYIGSGKNSIFTQALLDGLVGKGVANHRGYISAFSLYEYIYETVVEVAEVALHVKQEPELTVIKGVGPFAVSLYRGATALGEFDSSAPVPQLPSVSQVKPEKAERLMNSIRMNSPKVNITDSPGAIGGYIGGSVNQTFNNLSGETIDQRRRNFVEGSYIEGNVNTGGGDFVGRDKHIYGGENRLGIAPAGSTGSHSSVFGRGTQSNSGAGISILELKSLLAPLYSELEKTRPEQRAEAKQSIQALQDELAFGKNSDDSRMSRLVERLFGLIPCAAGTIVCMFDTPTLSVLVGPATQSVLNQIRGHKAGENY